jgi:KaiC/GvpD/RAD55 family RecA-like ATPase
MKMMEKAGTRTFPREILSFMAGPGGHSLIVRGMAGTGKTTLALQLIEEMSHIQQSYYMSTRVSDQALFNQFPWLQEKVKEGEVLKARKKLRKKAESDMDMEKIMLGLAQIKEELKTEKKLAPRKELNKLEGNIEAGEEGPATPSGESEMVVTVGSLMPEIEMAYDVVDRVLPDRTLVVIDSIDALSEKYGVPSSKLVNALQKDLVEGAGTNVVYVLETPDPMMDYLGDGVIYLSLVRQGERRLRILDILKLRGCEIKQPQYVYTLLGGRVRTFEYWRYSKPENPIPFEPIPDPSDKLVSTGIKDLDNMLNGGVQKGNLILVELGRGVPAISSSAIETAMLCSFASQNRGVIWAPTKKVGADDARNDVLGFLTEEQFDKNVRILEPHATPGESRSYTLALEGEDVKVDLKWQNIQFALQGSKGPYLTVAGFDSLETIYGANVLDGMMDYISALLNSGGVFLAVATASSKSLTKLADMAHAHVRIDKICGVTVISGEEPFTPPYAMTPPNEGDFRPRLVPVL